MKRSSRLLLMMLFVLGVGTTITYGAELINERETEQIIANDDHLMNQMNQIGNRRYVALSSNLIVTEPTKEEKMYVSSQRSKEIELNGFFDESLELYLPQREYLVDPITGRLQEVKSERVILKYKTENYLGEETRQLTLNKVYTDKGIELVVDNSTATPPIHRSPNGEYYIFEDADSLFLIDSKSLTIRELTQPIADGINKFDLQKKFINEDRILYWATNPAWSNDSRKVVYLSNRSSPNVSYTEIRMSDIENSADTKIYSKEQPIGIIGWSQKGNILIWEYSRESSDFMIRELSLDGTLSPALLQNVDIVNISQKGDVVLFSETRPYQEIYAFHIDTREIKTVLKLENGIQFHPTVNISPGSSKIATLKYLGFKGEREIVIADLFTGEVSNISQQEGIIFSESPSWVNDDVLIINGSKDGKSIGWTINLKEGDVK